MPKPAKFVAPFSTIRASSLPEVGGKGANLGELVAAGLQVPDGFCVNTLAFRRYVAQIEDGESLYAELNNLSAKLLKDVEALGARIRQRLASGGIPSDIENEVIGAWEALGRDNAYAVRSSATAEDLPGASFAGQQDTFLNVLGKEALLESIRRCWASLFTDRAIVYRVRNGFDHRQVSLAVVVQRMISSDISGIMFTADPVTGRRHIATIEASYGLGEALVSGLVTADAFEVDKRTRTVVTAVVGDKLKAVRSSADGGTQIELLSSEEQHARSLTDEQAIELTNIGVRIERHFGQPQDIEWAIQDGDAYILQSRPITSLFPVPEGALAMADKTGEVQLMFSFGAVQGMLEPITPLGQDTIKGLFAGSSSLFGFRGETGESQNAIWSAAERLFINFTGVIRHPIGKRISVAFMGAIDEGAAQVLSSLTQQPRFMPSRQTLKLKTFGRLLRFVLPAFARMVASYLRPQKGRRDILDEIDDITREFDSRRMQVTDLADSIRYFESISSDTFSRLIPSLLPTIAAGVVSLNLLRKLVGNENALALTKGLPHNVTTQMDLALWSAAQRIRQDRASAELFSESDARTLAAMYLDAALPPTAQSALEGFLTKYGMRAIGEIDLGRARWKEDPSHIVGVLKGYLRIEDPERAPDAVFARGAAEAESRIQELASEVRKRRAGRIKSRLMGIAYRRIRELGGFRESPKFTMVRLFDMVRDLLLLQGQERVSSGDIARDDDLFFLHLHELKQMAGGAVMDWQSVIQQRRENYRREGLRTQIPKLLLSDGHAFYEGVKQDSELSADQLVGTPVSPGVAEGLVVVVRDPVGVNLPQGAILVCPGTDPAWTPLFLSAGGLVTEVGGMMTHGSVVAREYGIPAVVGVHKASTRLMTGQRVRVDGTAGTITLLDDLPANAI